LSFRSLYCLSFDLRLLITPTLSSSFFIFILCHIEYMTLVADYQLLLKEGFFGLALGKRWYKSYFHTFMRDLKQHSEGAFPGSWNRHWTYNRLKSTNNYCLRNNSWKPEFVYSFNMGNIIFVNILSRAIARDKMQRK